MATVKHFFEPAQMKLPDADFPTPDMVENTTPTADTFRDVLKFDASTDQHVYLPFSAIDYGSGNITVTIEWSGIAQTSNAVQFGADLAAITPNTDSTSISAKAHGTAATATDTHLGTTATRLHSFDITISSLDSLAADDDVMIHVYRDADDAADTFSEDCVVSRIIISYSDT